jgi:phenylalanine-4-hydroxylase
LTGWRIDVASKHNGKRRKIIAVINVRDSSQQNCGAKRQNRVMNTTSLATPAGFDVSSKTRDGNPGLRGNYSAMRADYTVPQHMTDYTSEQQARWSRLVEGQLALIPGRACHEFLDAVLGNPALDMRRGIPNFTDVNVALKAATNWELVAVPGLLPDDVFFTHLANRRFPVTVWLREESEFDYIVEPDIFHDFFGHVPMLFTPIYADHLEAYGHGALKAKRLGALDWLGRLYWYTIEFGLIRENGKTLAYGAGVLSSPKELVYAIESLIPKREPFDVMTSMRTKYLIDDVQTTYFVLDSLQQLRDDTAPDFTPYYAALAKEQSSAST